MKLTVEELETILLACGISSEREHDGDALRLTSAEVDHVSTVQLNRQVWVSEVNAAFTESR